MPACLGLLHHKRPFFGVWTHSAYQAIKKDGGHPPEGTGKTAQHGGQACIALLVFVAFGLHVAQGGAFEMRTVYAMALRSAVWGAIAFVVQVVAYFGNRLVIRDLPARITANETAAGTFAGIVALGVGLLNAASMTY